MTQTELERLIECYFDGMTTVEQEAALRESLAQCRWQSETINEAKAVMGYFVAHSQQRASRQLSPCLSQSADIICGILMGRRQMTYVSPMSTVKCLTTAMR